MECNHFVSAVAQALQQRIGVLAQLGRVQPQAEALATQREVALPAVPGAGADDAAEAGESPRCQPPAVAGVDRLNGRCVTHEWLSHIRHMDAGQFNVF